MRESKNIRVQVCLDSKTYFKIMQEYQDRYGETDKSNMSLSNFVRLLILKYFDMEEEKTDLVNKFNKTLQKVHTSLDQKHTKIAELENHIKHLEMKIRLKEAHK